MFTQPILIICALLCHCTTVAHFLCLIWQRFHHRQGRRRPRQQNSLICDVIGYLREILGCWDTAQDIYQLFLLDNYCYYLNPVLPLTIKPDLIPGCAADSYALPYWKWCGLCHVMTERCPWYILLGVRAFSIWQTWSTCVPGGHIIFAGGTHELVVVTLDLVGELLSCAPLGGRGPYPATPLCD